MANKVILIDTSILIEYFRRTDKSNSTLYQLYARDYDFCISAISEFEVYSGATKNQLDFWNELLKNIDVLPFDHKAVKIAVEINSELKQKRKQIGIADLLIASTAISNKLRFATLNKKHFERIGSIEMVN